MEMIECGERTESGTCEALLIFKREQLLYDIKNYCYIEGHLLGMEQDEVRHTLQDVGEDGNGDRVTRVLDMAHTEAVEMLYPFTKVELRDRVLDDRLREKEVYGIVMKVPEEFSQTTLNSLEKLVHEFLVCRAVADWMSITNPAKAEIWRQKAEEAKEQIRSKPRLRRGVLRRKLHPF